jgi:signal transduction histidine kinase
MAQKGETLLLGTQNGLLISYDTKANKAAILAKLPGNHGGISYMKALNGERVLIGMPLLTYVFDITNHVLKIIDPIRSVKEADQIDGAIIAATSSNMIILPNKNDNATFNAFKGRFKGLDDYNYNFFGTNFRILQRHIRSRAICYSQADQTIWVSFKNGLYKVNRNGVTPFYYHGSPVYTSCLTAYGNEVIAGTSGNGIILINKGNVRRLTTDDGLLSNNIINVRVIGNNLWVYTSSAVQLFDLQSLRLIYRYSFPDPNSMPVTDAHELNNSCYFISPDGLYRVMPVHKELDSVSIYLNALFVNRKDTGIVDNLDLPNTSNDIQVSLGTPYLLNARDIAIRYSLITGNDAHWIYARHGERTFHFASLAPGVYSFQAQAIKLETGKASKPFIINFTIRPPWWQTWLFRIALISALALIISAIIRMYYLNQLRKQQIEYEKKLIVERERQHISREIHDNIGQALSVIKLNLDMTSPSEISDVKDLIGEVIQDLRQFTHGLYYGKLLTEGLIDVIKKDVERINNSKQLVASLSTSISRNLENEQSELLIYRIFQESVNNILKHAHAKNVVVKIRSNKKLFKLSIADDGQGFSVENAGKGLGFDSMYKRAELLKGQLSINSRPGEGCEVELTIDHKQSIS